MPSDYDRLMETYEDVVTASSIKSVLAWDIETNKMPEQGLDHRSKQLEYLTRQEQRFWTSPKVTNLLSSINDQKLDQVQRRNVELVRRTHTVRQKMDQDLLTKLSSQANKTNAIWKKAKAQTDFSLVKEDMKELFALNKEYADKLADIKDMNSAFDALIDERDEGLTADSIRSYFNEARDFLVPFIQEHATPRSDTEQMIRNIALSRDEEMLVSEYIADLFQYPYHGEDAKGSIDEVEHPLTITCGPCDVRITLKFGDYIKVINSTAHELGHAVDKLRRTREWQYLPINNTGGPTIAECNSRYTENKIGKAYEFYVNLCPDLKDITNYRFKDVKLDDLYNTVIKIEPSMYRTQADEVTYGLHIIIRFEIEEMLFNDELTIDELPQVWNEKYQDYLGVEVPNNTAGVMQDLHWYSVYYGYFHGYFMGDLLGSQFHHSMEQDIPTWKESLAEGNLSPVLEWQTENIYSKGNLHPPLELLKEVTGEDLDVNYFKKYIKEKYSDLT